MEFKLVLYLGISPNERSNQITQLSLFATYYYISRGIETIEWINFLLGSKGDTLNNKKSQVRLG